MSDIPGGRDARNPYAGLTPQQQQLGVALYEADKDLTPQDRQIIANDLRSMTTRANLWTLVDATAAFFIPTAYRSFKMKSQKVPASEFLKQPVIHRKPLSAAIGFAVLLAAFPMELTYRWQNKINSLAAQRPSFPGEVPTESERQLKMWKAMPQYQAALFYGYMSKTARDQSHVFQDPRQFHGDSMFQDLKDGKDGKSWDVEGSDAGSTLGAVQDSGLPHWDHIREENGFRPVTGLQSDKTGFQSDSEFQGTKEFLAVPESDPPVKRSAWDAVRSGK